MKSVLFYRLRLLMLWLVWIVVPIQSAVSSNSFFTTRIAENNLQYDSAQYNWAVKVSGVNNNSLSATTADDSGNIYIAGDLYGTMTFGNISISGTTDLNAYIAKYNAEGNVQWAVKASGSARTSIFCIAADKQGNSFIAGCFYSTATFGSITLTGGSPCEIFIAKIDPSGNFIWAKKAGGTSWDAANGITVDASGNIYITGYFNGSATFGTKSVSSSRATSAFIAKYNTSGDCLWVKEAGYGASGVYGDKLSVDAANNIYLVGRIYGASTIGTASVSFYGGSETFFAKFDASGVFMWVKSMMCSGNESIKDVYSDAAGNTYISGSFAGSATFGSYSLTTTSTVSAFLAKFDSTSTCVWAKQQTGSGKSVGTGCVSDTAGNVYFAGYFNGVVSFGALTISCPADTNDIYWARYDALGNCISVSRIGGIEDDAPTGIRIDSYGRVLMAGEFSQTIAFDNTSLTSSGATDIFISSIRGVNQSSITLKSPNGGEKWHYGDTDTIKWVSSGIANVKIEYSTDNGTNWTTIAASTIASAGQFAWTVPTTGTLQAKIRVSDASNSSFSGISASAFSITYAKSCPDVPFVTYSGQTYNSVLIGNQCWLKENLNIGTRLSSNVAQTNNSIIEKYCYNGLDENCATYGGLYQWNEAMKYVTDGSSLQGICPTGWHLPTALEFQNLADFVSGNTNAVKELGQGSGAGAGTNTTGFSSLLGGSFSFQGYYASIGTSTFYWGSEVYDATNSSRMGIYYNESAFYISYGNKGYGHAVRCINNLPGSELPVELSSFTASSNGKGVQLHWATATEVNSSSFSIQKKTVTTDSWSTVASIPAAGNSNVQKDYSYFDKGSAPGKYSYRLKMIDNDGTFKYSNTVEVNVSLHAYSLGQNYPNPFNPATVISYQIPVTGQVTLIVFDMLGNEVATLVNEIKQAGSYHVTYNGAGLASGVYFYQLKAGNFTETKKFSLIK